MAANTILKWVPALLFKTSEMVLTLTAHTLKLLKWPLALLFVTAVHQMGGKSFPRLEMFKRKLGCNPGTWLGSCMWARVCVYCGSGYVPIQGVVKLGNFCSPSSPWEPMMQKKART